MAVWIIPASDSKSQENYPKTLTSPVSAQRRAALPHDPLPPESPLFAWGFPNNDRNKKNALAMKAGDICLFYMRIKEGGGYLRAAKVFQIATTDQQLFSSALWDSPDFIPYFLEEPVELALTPQELGKSLSSDGTYWSYPPRGASPITDMVRAKHAIATFGSIDNWALKLIGRPQQSKPIAIDSAPVAAKGALPIVTDLLRTTVRRETDEQPGAQASRRFSRNAKAIGDAGEKAVLTHLQATLSATERQTLRWIANEGLFPGWDIEYVDRTGQQIAVEVKSTTGQFFLSFEITENERRAAERLCQNYHLYLVGSCNANPRLQIITDPWATFHGQFTPTAYLVKLTEN